MMLLHVHCDHKPVHVVYIFVNRAQVLIVSVAPFILSLVLKIEDFQADFV